jgi:hypothetical protein
MIQELDDPSQRLRQDIVANPADADVIISQPRTANLFHQIIDRLALAQCVDKGRHRTDVLAEGADGDQMAGQAIELARDHAAEFTAPGDFRAGQFFRGHAERLIGEHRGEIIRPVGVRHIAVISNLLADLFDGAV